MPPALLLARGCPITLPLGHACPTLRPTRCAAQRSASHPMTCGRRAPGLLAGTSDSPPRRARCCPSSWAARVKTCPTMSAPDHARLFSELRRTVLFAARWRRTCTSTRWVSRSPIGMALNRRVHQVAAGPRIPQGVLLVPRPLVCLAMGPRAPQGVLMVPQPAMRRLAAAEGPRLPQGFLMVLRLSTITVPRVPQGSLLVWP